ncbi:MAG: HAMP domain-containing histidine kinase [Verrucomicrobia bacterium]|nr:HAMP domain-containing histidine kinase [Verrucomicrobiota bacterium]
MKKVALLFVLAVLVPSVLLAFLAARTLRDQQFVVERQQSLLYQAVTDALAKDINDYLTEQQRQFNELVENLVTNPQPRAAAATFDDRLRAAWPLAEVGFCVTLGGNLLCPSPTARPETRSFCLDNGGFLANRESVEVYWNDNYTKGQNQIALRGGEQQAEAQQSFANRYGLNSARGEVTNYSPPVANLKSQSRKVNPAQQLAQVPAQNEPDPSLFNASKVMSTEAEFRQLIGDANDGSVARFVQNKLRLMFWHRLARDPQLVFGAQVDLDSITSIIRLMVKSKAKSNYIIMSGQGRSVNSLHNFSKFNPTLPTLPDEICLVVLDDNAKPVATSDPWLAMHLDLHSGIKSTEPIDSTFRKQFKTSLKHPFVATEIGEALPHWEVAAYLMNPEALKKTALTIRISLGLLIAVLLIAMIVGSWLIVNDLNRQVTLARQKTDFVSNVSHELKTPLTSIRMFSELLADGRISDPAKQRSYLHIITAEAARLTRLINNVLDFARLERGEKKYNFRDCDLVEVARETAESYRPHLENNGFTLERRLGDAPLKVRGDADALAQILVNLLSNAEKYSNESKQIEIETARHETPLPYAEVRVLDRGLGVPAGCEEKIFENFYRAHDSLASGIQGSGLGLTLARQMARAHGGDVTYERRAGGGSCFVLRVPLKPI